MKTYALAAAALAAASVAAVSNSAQAAVVIALQQDGVNGGAITQVASGSGSAVYNLGYGTFEANFLTAADAFDPTLLDSTISVHTATGTTGGTFDLYLTLTDITGPLPPEFFNSFTSNSVPTGWSVFAETLIDPDNAAPTDAGFTAISNFSTTFTAAGTDGAWNAFAGGSGPYSVTHHYRVTTPAGLLGCDEPQNPACATDILATGRTVAGAVAVPEPGTWALMIVGFGGAGVVLRRRRERLAHA